MTIRHGDDSADEILQAALRGAGSDDSDESIRVRLRDLANGDALCLRDALLGLGVEPSVDSYLTNRARRLLEASIEDRPVNPTPAEQRALFEREKRLDRMAVDAAYAELCKREPRLVDLKAQAAQQHRLRPRRGLRAGVQDVRLASRLTDVAAKLAGPDAAGNDPLLRTPTAGKIAIEHVLYLAGFLAAPPVHDEVDQ